MDKLGEYITQEYGLLKQILHCLPAKDLISARQVCIAWAEVVEVILTEENKPVWGYGLELDKFEWFEGFLQTIPKIIFYFKNSSRRVGTRSYSVAGCKDLEICPCKYGDGSIELIVIEDQILSYKQRISFGPASYDFMLYESCVLLLPSMPGLEVNSAIIYRNDPTINQEVTAETVDQLIGMKPIKCLLIYTHKIIKRGRIWIISFLNQVLEREGHSIAIGGGDSSRLNLFKGKGKCKGEKPFIYIVTIRGDNVSAHSELLGETTKIGIDKFMKELAEEVGPVPNGSERLAFVVKCVNRCFFWENEVEDMTYEGKCFKSAFPNVPHFGFLGYGEYGINTNELLIALDIGEKKRKKGFQVAYSNSTSIVILTIHNIHQARKRLHDKATTEAISV